MAPGRNIAVRALLRRRALRSAVAGVAAAAGAAACTSTAGAVVAGPGYGVSSFATGFASHRASGVGPVGLAFSPGGSVYVSDPANGNVYEFGSAGGIARSSTRVSSSPYGDGPRGLAFGRHGRLYLALTGWPAVVEIDPSDGRILRFLTTKVPCPVGLAVDPVSGDLFVSTLVCSTAVYRISNPASRAPSVTRYATGFSDLDGMAFAPDGTLWAAERGGRILSIGGTSSSAPGATRHVTSVAGADGLAVQAGPGPSASGVFVNGNDGRLTRVDLGTLGVSTVMSGGSRGDFLGAGADGRLYATQSDRIVRIRSATSRGGRIPDLVPTNPQRPPARPRAVDVIRMPIARVCFAPRHFRIRLVGWTGARYVSAVVWFNGHRVKDVARRRLTRPIVLKAVPTGRFRVTVEVRRSTGRTYRLSRKYRVCASSR